MSMLTIELSDTMTRQIQNKGISQQQLETAFIRAIQAYFDETLPVQRILDNEQTLRPVKNVARPSRGCSGFSLSRFRRRPTTRH
ncbi:hypothetical protein U14_00563 [Candidatus Moduliflexus flocculans]|uniref:Uncharacterized protein n=1 Tax=Candidatus Moduliflexus flocculans TaxID=1499966 RepID=A0A0S6VQ79_9BACT|nr:hypothetical protein U14_00563 [Candidatus Moduliflexus flocculans]